MTFLFLLFISTTTTIGRQRALVRFLDHVIKTYKDTYFVTFQQMINWVRDPRPVNQLGDVFKCHEPPPFPGCNRPHTCAVKHYVNSKNIAATAETATRSDTRYMAV